MDIADEIRKLEELRRSGALSEEEFTKAKAATLEKSTQGRPASSGLDANQWATFLHLSLLAGFVVPFAGLVVPIIIWQLKKNEFPSLDAHGKVVMNWLISEVIYAVAGIILTFLIIGIPMLIALGVVGIVFPVIGAIKANNGELWNYPLSITFLK
jgi:uncharacterized protein